MKTTKREKEQSHFSLVEIFCIPSWIALASGVGLVSALLGDGWWNMVSWVALASPIGAIWWGIYFSNRKSE